MTTAVQRRRGTSTQHGSFTGLEGEITVDTTKKTAVVHDGSTAGGVPLAKEDLSNTPVTVTAGKAVSFSNSLAFAGTDATTMTFPGASGTVVTEGAAQTLTSKTINLSSNTLTGTFAQFNTAVSDATLVKTTDKINVLAATTSAELAGVISDETGTGSLVFANSPTLVTPTLGAASATSVTLAAGTASAPSLTTTGDTNTGIFFPAADTIAFTEGGVEAMRIDSSGNLGLGVTPSAWASTWKAFQIENRSLAQTGSGAGDWTMAFNAVFDSTDSRWEYQYTGDSAVRYSQTGAGVHAWFTAPSGTAGNAITFTQAMTLDANGNLGLGTTSPQTVLNIVSSGSRGLVIETAFPTIALSDTDNSDYKSFIAQANADLLLYNLSASGIVSFYTNGTERARITSGGNLLVGETTGAERLVVSGTTNNYVIKSVAPSTSGTYFHIVFDDAGTSHGAITSNGTNTTYATSSDYRLKENIVPMTGALSKVQALNPVTWSWKTNGNAGEGFIAHELQAVVPDAVTGEKDAVDAEGKPIYQGVDTSFLVATLTAALQEAHSLIKDLQSRVAALESK